MSRFFRRLATVLGTFAVIGVLSAGAAGAAVTGNTPDGTPQCGTHCFNLWNLQLGQFQTQNAYVNNGKTGAVKLGKVGTPVNLHRYGNTRSNGDFQALVDTTVGTVATPDTACGDGLLAPASVFCVNPQFASSAVIEAQFTPFGQSNANLCVGLAAGSTLVTLQTCGVSNRTIWVADYKDGEFGDTPWINGSATSFSNPSVLTVNTSSSKPQDRLWVRTLVKESGTPADYQEFGFNFGVTP